MPNLYFYTVAIGFMSGIGARSFLSLGMEVVFFMLLLSFACAFVWRVRREAFRTPVFLVSIFLFASAVGVLRFESADTSPLALDISVGTFVTVEGVVIREPDIREKSVHLYVRDEVTSEYILVRANAFLDVAYGDRVTVRGELTYPEAFMTDTGRMFAYPGYLKARGVRYVIEEPHVSVGGGGGGSAFLTQLFSWKHACMSALERVIPEPAVSLGEGITLGVKRALGDELEDVFREVGLIHIVVLSGYNIMIIVEYLMRMLSYVFRPRMRMVVGLCGITVFALFVGLSATVVRASLMAALVLLARGTGRTYVILRALMCAGVVMILINPYLLVFDPGFQLSFLATLGLILLAPHCMQWFRAVPEKWGIREVVSATIATQLFVLPLILYEMGTLSIVAIIANLLVLPIVPFAMLLVFMTGLLGLVSNTLALIPGFFAYGVLGYIITAAELLAAFPFASFTVHVFPLWATLVLYTFLGGWLWYLHMLKTAREEGESSVLTVHSSYDDWVIEEEENVEGEKEKTRDTRSLSPTSRLFPFR